VDIRLTRDKRLVLMHDSSVDRTTDGQGAVCDLLLSEVRQLNAAHCFPQLPATTVPTLEEFLEEFAGSATRYSPDLLFMFDFKDEASIEQAWPLIHSYPTLRNRYILGAIFESPNTLLREKRLPGTPLVTDIAQTFALTIAYNTGLWSLYEFGQHDIFGYVLQSQSPVFLSRELIDALHAKGMRVMVCGPLLAQRPVLEHYIACGADYIMVDSIETDGHWLL
jgi:glycerophosphoryl diester phosphodiesterase